MYFCFIAGIATVWCPTATATTSVTTCGWSEYFKVRLYIRTISQNHLSWKRANRTIWHSLFWVWKSSWVSQKLVERYTTSLPSIVGGRHLIAMLNSGLLLNMHCTWQQISLLWGILKRQKGSSVVLWLGECQEPQTVLEPGKMEWWRPALPSWKWDGLCICSVSTGQKIIKNPIFLWDKEILGIGAFFPVLMQNPFSTS